VGVLREELFGQTALAVVLGKSHEGEMLVAGPGRDFVTDDVAPGHLIDALDKVGVVEDLEKAREEAPSGLAGQLADPACELGEGT
jgi:hypothetical protein